MTKTKYPDNWRIIETGKAKDIAIFCFPKWRKMKEIEEALDGFKCGNCHAKYKTYVKQCSKNSERRGGVCGKIIRNRSSQTTTIRKKLENLKFLEKKNKSYITTLNPFYEYSKFNKVEFTKLEKKFLNFIFDFEEIRNLVVDSNNLLDGIKAILITLIYFQKEHPNTAFSEFTYLDKKYNPVFDHQDETYLDKQKVYKLIDYVFSKRGKIISKITTLVFILSYTHLIDESESSFVDLTPTKQFYEKLAGLITPIDTKVFFSDLKTIDDVFQEERGNT